MNKINVGKIIIRDKIYIDKYGVENPADLVNSYTYNTGTEFLSTIEEDDDYFIVPSNSYHKLEWSSIDDQRTFSKLDYDMTFRGTLRKEQKQAVDMFMTRGRARSGLLQAKPGWGKTFAGCNIIAQTGVKTLVLVHTALLFDQWVKEATSQLEGVEIGKIGDGYFTIKDVTIAIYKTVYNNLETLKNQFSMVIVDEAHKCPADMFSTVVNGLSAKIKIAITATPFRKDGKHLYLSDYFSTFRVVAEDLRDLATPSVKVIETDFKFAVTDPKRDWARALNALCADTAYIQLIAYTAIGLIKQKRCVLIFCERVDTLKQLEKLIPKSICLIGSTPAADREKILNGAGTDYDCILTTKLFDEGISCHRLDTEIFTCPSNNPVLLEQRIGRIERIHEDKQYPLVVDIWLRGAIVNRQQANRMAFYESKNYNIL